jgi:hypothetical protein
MKAARIKALIAIVALGAVSAAQVPPGTLITTGRVLIVGEPRAVTGQNVVQLSSSPSGRYLLVVRENPVAQSVLAPPPSNYNKPVALELWDSQTGGLRELASFDQLEMIQLVEGYSPTQRGEYYMDRARVDWITGADKAIVSVTIVKPTPLKSGMPETVDRFYRSSFFLDAKNGTFRRIYSQEDEGGHSVRIVPCPVSPVAVKCVAEDGRNGVTLQTLSADGTWGIATRTSNSVLSIGQSAWSADGTKFHLEVKTLPEGASRIANLILTYVPGQQGYQLEPGPLSSYEAPAMTRELTLVKEQLGEGASPPSRWKLRTVATSEEFTFTVSVGAQFAYLPVCEKFVAYVVDGVLFTRILHEITRSQLGAWQAEGIKEDAIRRAERIAGAVSIFARENNDAIPSALDVQSGALAATLVSAEELKGFKYTCIAKKMGEVQDSATAAFGYIETPVGRAVIYLDQSVKWEPQKGG